MSSYVQSIFIYAIGTMTPDALYQKKLKLDLHKTKYTYVNPRIKIVLESTANTSPATP